MILMCSQSREPLSRGVYIAFAKTDAFFLSSCPCHNLSEFLYKTKAHIWVGVLTDEQALILSLGIK